MRPIGSGEELKRRRVCAQAVLMSSPATKPLVRL